MENNISDSKDTIKAEVISLIKNICDLSEKIATIIDGEIKENNFITDKEIEQINGFYKERELFVNSLKSIIEAKGNELLNNNAQWNRYVNEIVPIEKTNIDFLKKKVNETKSKLGELYHNRSLMIYNKKEELSYENRIL